MLVTAPKSGVGLTSLLHMMGKRLARAFPGVRGLAMNVHVAHATLVHADWCLAQLTLRLSAALHTSAVQRRPCLHAGIGNTRAGLHPVQERLARAHGSQCGFCTPGFVMSMYALLRSRPAPPSEQDIEENLAGNLWCGPGRLVEPPLCLQDVEAVSADVGVSAAFRLLCDPKDGHA